MQIIIKNIWKIKEAKVNLNWLTIIAWNNNSWKSTVSKIVFSLIKAFQRYKEDFDYTKEKILEREIGALYFHLRNNIIIHSKLKKDHISLNDLLRKEFYPPIFINELTVFWSVDLFNNKKELIKNLWLLEDEEKILLNKIDKVKELFLKDEKKEDLIKRALEDILKSEFENEFNNIKLWKVGTITLMEWIVTLFQIDIENNKISNVKINDVILEIKDTTFIDTPITLNLFNYLINIVSYPWRRNKEIQFHIRDLFSKIWNSKFEKERQNWFWEKIKDLVGWTFEIIQRGTLWDELTFIQNWKNINPINTATWIKSFWILDLLDRSHCLDDSNLLIVDEPEVHLLPELQVKYAELIVWLVKERWLTVLITSHSPYLIEWLNKFSKDNNIRDKFNLYLTKEETWYDIIENKTDNAGEVFERLSAPFEKLVWW